MVKYNNLTGSDSMQEPSVLFEKKKKNIGQNRNLQNNFNSLN